ncbi:MAG: FtsX-like permease family protein [Gemmatimonadetes bacterium]|nr:FtsX-like permease family protein [Gemmatimonadota bacterium]MYD26668.1 FtsX-like permease family protein [Gemmatimonadota bacterium]MYI99595.1 FtsX-like permease family protein [Gemmatimonadota bacterium]
MIRNYITTAIRNLLKHKGYSLVNVIGLALGLAGCILMLLYIRYETSYDDFHLKQDRMYRIEVDMLFDGRESKFTTTPSAWGPVLLAEYPSIENLTRLRPLLEQQPVQLEDRSIRGKASFFADSTLFDVFTLPLARGTPATALTRPHTIVLSESMANTCFGETDPTGSPITLDLGKGNTLPLTVTGVVRDLPENSHLRFDFLISYVTLESLGWGEPANMRDHGGDFNIYTYLLLREGYSARELEQQLPGFIERHLGDVLRAFGMEQNAYLRPVGDIHLYTYDMTRGGGTGDIRTVYVAFLLAAFILVLACANFINLTTARSLSRASEVGMRKVLGGTRAHAMLQYIGESVLLTLFALGLSIVLLQTLLPAVNDLLNQNINLELTTDTMLMLAGVVLLVGILAGTYPAFVISSFQPTAVLRGSSESGATGALFRRILIVFQFTVSVVLIIGTWTISDQLDYMLSEDLGFEEDGVVLIDMPERAYEVFRDNALRYPEILAMARSSTMFENSYSVGGLTLEDVPLDQQTLFQIFSADIGFSDIMGLELVEGRFLSRERSADADACLINETAVRALGLEDPVGTTLLGPSKIDNVWQQCEVIGVVRDFNVESLRGEILPMKIALAQYVQQYGSIVVKIDSSNEANALNILREQWNRVYPDLPEPEFTLLKDKVAGMYEDDHILRTVFTAGSTVSILIACLGLLGLSAFMVQRRIREIGVRKVLGATVGQIVVLLYREFTLYVLIAWVVGVPLIYYMADVWLRDFAYRIEPNPWTFIFAGVVMMLITWFTVGFQTVKAAETNPVEVLRG